MLKWLSGILTTVLSGWILHDRLLHRLRSWSWHILNSDIAQGSVVTQLRYGEIISQGCVANLLVNLSVKEVWKSVNIWRVMDNIVVPCFFDSQCMLWPCVYLLVSELNNAKMTLRNFNNFSEWLNFAWQVASYTQVLIIAFFWTLIFHKVV